MGHILRELRTDLQPHFLGLHRQQWSRYGVNSTAPSTRLVVFFPERSPCSYCADCIRLLKPSIPIHILCCPCTIYYPSSLVIRMCLPLIVGFYLRSVIMRSLFS